MRRQIIYLASYRPHAAICEAQAPFSQTCARGLRSIMLDHDTEFAELKGACLSVLWGALIVAQGFGFLSRGLAAFAPDSFFLESVWGTIFIALGSFQLLAFYFNHTRARKLLALIACSLWLALLALYCVGTMRQNLILALAQTINSAWAYLRISSLR